MSLSKPQILKTLSRFLLLLAAKQQSRFSPLAQEQGRGCPHDCVLWTSSQEAPRIHSADQCQKPCFTLRTESANTAHFPSPQPTPRLLLLRFFLQQLLPGSARTERC